MAGTRPVLRAHPSGGEQVRSIAFALLISLGLGFIAMATYDHYLENQNDTTQNDR